MPLYDFGGGNKNLVAGPDGRFSIQESNIGPICCFIWIRHPDKELVGLGTATLDDGDPQEQKQEQRLADAGMVIIRATPRKILILPPAILSGVVRDPKGKPIAGATVSARVDASHMGRSGVFATTQTNQDGRYRLALAGLTIASYAISAQLPGYSDADKCVNPNDLIDADKPVDLDDPFKKATVDLVLFPNDRTVRGIVKDLKGRPVPGAVLTAKRTSKLESYPGCVVSDAQGRFVLEHLDNAETINISAHVPGRGWIGQFSLGIDPGKNEVEVQVGPSFRDY
jgi:hypothetical protein